MIRAGGRLLALSGDDRSQGFRQAVRPTVRAAQDDKAFDLPGGKEAWHGRQGLLIVRGLPIEPARRRRKWTRRGHRRRPGH